MSKHTTLAWLAVGCALLVAACLLVIGPAMTSRAEAPPKKVMVDPHALTVSEPSGSGTFTLTLNSQPTATVSISWLPTNGQCTVSPGTVTLDGTNWETGAADTVTAVDDFITDGRKICPLQAEPTSSTDLDFNGLSVPEVNVTVNDNDAAGVDIDPTSLAIVEAGASKIFTITLTSQPAYTVSVPLSAIGGQCTVSPGSVSLNATNWNTGAIATVSAVDDSIIDGPQICTIQSGPTSSTDTNYAGLYGPDVTVTVNDNDVANVTVDPTSLTVTEGGSPGTFTIRLTAQPTTTVSVPLSAIGGQCTVSPSSATLNATNWNTGATATVTAVDDSIIDGPQICTIQSGPTSSTDTNYSGLYGPDVTVTVNDNDGANVTVDPTSLTVTEGGSPGTFTIRLTSQPTATVSIALSASSGQCSVSPGSLTLDATNWNTGANATVTAVDDLVADGDQICWINTGRTVSTDPDYFDLPVSDVRVTVLDNDVASVTVTPPSLTIAEGGSPGTFTIRLTSQPIAPVSIAWSASSGQCTVSPGSATLDATTWNTGATATVTAVDDSIADGPQPCTIQTGLASSTDPTYNGLPVPDVPVTVNDNDVAGVTVTPPSLTIAEGGSPGTFTIRLTSQPIASVSIAMSAANGQCTVSPGSLTLDATNWNTGAAATVTAVDDSVVDGPQSCPIQTGSASSGDPNYSGLPVPDVPVTVNDNDVAGVTVYPPSLTISEPSGADIFTIRLSTQPLAAVSIALSASNGQCTVSPGSVTLNATNWNTGAPATVTAVDDFIVDGSQSCPIQTGSTSSTDPAYNGLPVPDVPVTVNDNDLAGVTVTPPSLTIAEGGSPGTFTIRLTSQPIASVSIALSASNGQCTVSPGSLTLNATTWNTGATATVTAVDDSIVDGPQSCPIQTGSTSSSDTNYSGLPVPDVPVTVNDNDVAGATVDPTSLTVAEGGSPGTFTIRLTSQPIASVSVALSASNGQCTVSPASVTLNATNWNTGAPATVTAVDDFIDDGPQPCPIQTGPTSSTDPNYAGLPVPDVSVTVNDNDVAGTDTDPTSLTIAEGGSPGTFIIHLTSQPIASVSVALSASNGQCTVLPASVTLDATNWNTGATATVTAVDDFIDDGPQPCPIQTGPTSSTDPNYAGLPVPDVSVTVNDNDVAGADADPTSLTVAEPSGSANFIIHLTSQPIASVSVALSASNGQCTVSPASVTLDATNWNTGATATITAVDDFIVDGDQNCPIRTGSTSSTDPNYAGLPVPDVAVTVGDNDVAGAAINPTSLTVREPSGSAVFTFTVTSQPIASVMVPLSAPNGQCTVSTTLITLKPVDWSTGVTATVTAVDDHIRDGTQSCPVQVGPTSSADPNYDGLDAHIVPVTVHDVPIVSVYLPLILSHWPPVPASPTLQPIDNTDGDGNYTIAWTSTPRAELYILEEGRSSTMSGAQEIYSGTSTSYSVVGRGAARYYYRVKARNASGDSEWSAMQSADVLWEAEPNNEAHTQANGPIVSGLTYYGTFPSGADSKDYFYFELFTAHSVELWLTHIPAGQNYDLILRDSALTAVGYSANPGNADEHIVSVTLPTGRYYIQVYNSSSGGSTQPYHLKVIYK